MAREPGLYLYRDIYYSIEYDDHQHVYCAFFVHNNIVSKKDLLKTSSVTSICEQDQHLHVKITNQKEKPNMLLWHYWAQHKKIEYLKNLTELSIKRIRDWETLHREKQKYSNNP